MSKLYPKGAEGLLDGSIVLTTDTIKVAICRTDQYTQSDAHQFMSSVTKVQDLSAALSSKSVALGVFDAADGTFSAVPAQGGNVPLDCLVIYKDTGSAATSRVIAYLDGFSIVANGGDIQLVWDNGTPRIFRIG